MPLHHGSRSNQDERLRPPPTRTFSRRSKTACGELSIDGEAVWRAERPVADGERDFKDEFSLEPKALTTHPRRCRSHVTISKS
jgi:hypothetical protein